MASAQRAARMAHGVCRSVHGLMGCACERGRKAHHCFAMEERGRAVMRSAGLDEAEIDRLLSGDFEIVRKGKKK